MSVINKDWPPPTRGSAGAIAGGKPKRIPPWRWLVVVVVVCTTLACGPIGAGGSSSGQSTSPPSAQQVTSIGAGVGQLAPSFLVRTIDGLTLTSAELRAQEKPYILYFFASW